jgi:hypothetical protein
MRRMKQRSEVRSTRELVAEMTAKGLTPRQIALALGLTTQAIYKHLKAIERAKA